MVDERDLADAASGCLRSLPFLPGMPRYSERPSSGVQSLPRLRRCSPNRHAGRARPARAAPASAREVGRLDEVMIEPGLVERRRSSVAPVARERDQDGRRRRRAARAPGARPRNRPAAASRGRRPCVGLASSSATLRAASPRRGRRAPGGPRARRAPPAISAASIVFHDQHLPRATPPTGGAERLCAGRLGAHHPTRGQRRQATGIRCPSPGPALRASTRPPCSSTRLCTSASPMPRPPARARERAVACTNSSKTCGSELLAMPMPASRTRSTMLVALAARPRARSARRPACTWRRCRAGCRRPARGARGRRGATPAPAGSETSRLCLRASIAGRAVSTARSTTSASSTGSWRSAILPRRDARHVEQIVDQPRELERPAARRCSSARSRSRLPAAQQLQRRRRAARAGCGARARASRGTRPCAGRPRELASARALRALRPSRRGSVTSMLIPSMRTARPAPSRSTKALRADPPARSPSDRRFRNSASYSTRRPRSARLIASWTAAYDRRDGRVPGKPARSLPEKVPGARPVDRLQVLAPIDLAGQDVRIPDTPCRPRRARAAGAPRSCEGLSIVARTPGVGSRRAR